jgi:hypothetical protein
MNAGGGGACFVSFLHSLDLNQKPTKHGHPLGIILLNNSGRTSTFPLLLPEIHAYWSQIAIETLFIFTSKHRVTSFILNLF